MVNLNLKREEFSIIVNKIEEEMYNILLER